MYKSYFKNKLSEDYQRIEVPQLIEFINKSKIKQASYEFKSSNGKEFYVYCTGTGDFKKLEDGFSISQEDKHAIKVEYNQIRDAIFLTEDDKKFDLKDVKGNNLIITIL